LLIYPTRRAVALTALGAPIGVLLGVIAPGLWLVGAAWGAMALGLVLVDAGLGADRRKLTLTVTAPPSLGVGGSGQVEVAATFAGAAPSTAELALQTDARLAASPDRITMAVRAHSGAASFELKPVRRGEGRVERLFVRWQGPLGLVWKQRVEVLDRVVAVTPNIRAIQDEAIRLFARDALFGLKEQVALGEGSEYHALKEFQTGHDRGAVDWKQSARHGKLLVKEFRTERNHHLVFALDTGRLMSEPLDGQPRLDRALNAALLLAYVGLKMGDRVALFGFDAKPNLLTGSVAGTAAFGLLQRLAARLDYSAEETNYTLGLTSLAGALERRSLVVVFTDFADATSAQLMIENIGRLMRRHLVLFVAFRDEELETMVRAEPVVAEDVSRAVIAASLLRERQLVLERLRRMGAEIVDVPADRIGPALLSRYLDLKRRDLL
jgi:uncharacterized protein (DUF58 family)